MRAGTPPGNAHGATNRSKNAEQDSAASFASRATVQGIKVNAVSPGFTKTSLNNYEGIETVEEGAAEAVRIALLAPDGPTGTFTHARHGTIPW